MLRAHVWSLPHAHPNPDWELRRTREGKWVVFERPGQGKKRGPVHGPVSFPGAVVFVSEHGSPADVVEVTRDLHDAYATTVAELTDEQAARSAAPTLCSNRRCSNEVEFEDDDLCGWCREEGDR